MGTSKREGGREGKGREGEGEMRKEGVREGQAAARRRAGHDDVMKSEARA
jgi:hypothetical protein